ncbi:unnamed protein product [Prorocentrum cordatum]|uniref:SNARE associated Golgi protein n=1 Tax=Prorocentrum cordatum TaxID=2364126 RepID=A0ABN9XXR2_9DINO|nr:unnamed protein product [Polarella glacialis]
MRRLVVGGDAARGPCGVGKEGEPSGVEAAVLRIFLTVAIFFAVSLLLEHFAEERVSTSSRWLMDKVGLWGLFLAVLLADGLPQPFTYVPLIFLAVKGSAEKAAVFAVCAAASYVAAVAGYLIGANMRSCPCGGRFFRMLEKDYPAVGPLMEKKGALGVAVCAVLPVPLAAATWTAGAFEVRLLPSSSSRLPPPIAVFVLLSRGPQQQ